MIETDEYDFARPYIAPGETILWRGKPGKGHLLTGQDIFMIPFSIMWCGFAIFWESLAIFGGGPIFMALWGIPFVCVGLYMVFGRFLWTAFQRKRTAYVITNKKIIRARGSRIDMIHGNSLPPCTPEHSGTAAAPSPSASTTPTPPAPASSAPTAAPVSLPWKTSPMWPGSSCASTRWNADFPLES